MEYVHIYTICEQFTKHISDLTADQYSIYTPACTMKLFGIPTDWDEEKIEAAIDCEDVAVCLGSITGTLVLGTAIAENGESLYDCCDSASEYLEFAASALMEAGGPLCDENRNIFFITGIEVSDKAAFQNLLEELPDMIFTHLHVKPDIISVNPAPLPHEKSKFDKIQEDLAMIAYHETQKKLEKQIFGSDNDSDDDFADTPQLTVSPEQLNIVMGRRNEGATYPAEYIDRDAWQPFIDAGYSEWRNTRVLYIEY